MAVNPRIAMSNASVPLIHEVQIIDEAGRHKTVHVPGEHQRYHGSSRTEFADLQSAVVDEPLSRVCGNREHRGVHVGFADAYWHREYGSGNGVLRSGVLRSGHVATVMLADPGQVKIVEGNQ